MFPQAKALVVDDEEVIRDFCKAVLLKEGFLVDTAPNGQVALETLANDSYDLLLLDISMPVMNGLTVLEHLAREHRRVSPIMMTGYATLESAVHAQDLGAEGFILKPFDNLKLLKVVRRVIERSAMRRDYARLQTQVPLIALSHRLVTEQSLEALAEAALKIAREETCAADASLWLTPPPVPSTRWKETWPTTSPVCLAYIGAPILPPHVEAWSDLTQRAWMALDQQNNIISDIRQAQVVHISLQTEGYRVGILSLGNPVSSRCFTGKDLDFLSVMSSYLAVGLENRYLYEAIDLARQEWKTIFNTFNDGLLAYRAEDGVITRVNTIMATWLDTPVEALLHQPVSNILLNDQGQTFVDLTPAVTAAVTAAAKNGSVWQSVEITSPPWAPGKSFRVRTFSLDKRTGAAGQDRELAEVIHVLEDITLANKMQSQLLQTEKLSALGRLLASLAHEINNPLQALRSGLRLLARPNLSDEKRQQYVAMLDKEVERLIDTTGQTLDFARPGRLGKKPTHLNQLVRETLVLVNKQLQRHKIETSLELATDLPSVWVVPDQIKQVFLNLILNAIDAMTQGGQLTLTTRYLPGEAQVMVALVDTGRGVPEEIVNRIYEPFFSTKEAGTGLGLSISYSIVEAHGGYIELESSKGVGSKFSVYLPLNWEEHDGTT